MARLLYLREKDSLLISQDAGWAPGLVWMDGNISLPPGFFLMHSPAFCFYLIRTSFSVSIVLHFAFFVFYLERTKQPSMPPVGLKPAAPASGWQQTLALDRSANGIGLDPRTVQPVVSRYTDYAIPSYIFEYRPLLLDP
jgi:hypothetical protein